MNVSHETNIDDLTFIKYLKEIESPFLAKIAEVYEKVKEILNNRIQHIFPNYTLHNTGHSFRIMEYMSKLISNYRELNELEIVLLVYSALLHDIGMAVSQEDVDSIKADNFPYCDIKFSSMKKIMKDDESLALQEYVRRIHASLSKRYILENLSNDLTIPNLTSLNFINDIGLICQSHTEDKDWIKTNLGTHEVRGDYSFNPQYISIILRLADILDIDGNRTPHNLYKLISPEGQSDEEWKQHFVILNNEKIILNPKTNQKKIVFHGKANNPNIHRKILTYISWVEAELKAAVDVVNSMPDKYNLIYDTIPEVNIQTQGYSFSDYKMTLEFNAISSLLMGEKIYGDKTLGLRELIQNSIDACRIRAEKSNINFEFGEERYNPKIKVILDKNKNTVTIKDNGIGMSLDVIKKHFLNIGVSYYGSTDFKLKDYAYKPIGNFGIGFLSCFMLSDNVKVITRSYDSKSKFTIDLEKGNEWTSLTENFDVQFEGTEVILSYSNFIEVFSNNTETVRKFLEKFFITDDIQFELVDKDERKIINISNSIAIPENLEKGVLAIDLSNYLNEIEGYVLIKKKRNFVKQFSDLDFDGEIFMYEDEVGLKNINSLDDLNLDDYVIDNEINYLAIPLVEGHLENDFQNGLKFMDGDLEGVLQKYEYELRWISIIVKNEFQSNLYGETIGEGSYIFENFTFDDLVELGHSQNCKTESKIKTIKLFEGYKNKIYLPYKDNDTRYSYFYNRNKLVRELYIRNVLIKDFEFTTSVNASIFEINTIVVNINSRDFIPDISRNNLDAKQWRTIVEMITKTIHIAAIDILELDNDEIQTIKNFLLEFYPNKSKYERSIELT